MDEIRRKRLEKLQRATSAPSPAASTSNVANSSTNSNSTPVTYPRMAPAAPGAPGAVGSTTPRDTTPKTASKPAAKPPVKPVSRAPAAPSPIAPQDPLALLTQVLQATPSSADAEGINDVITMRLISSDVFSSTGKPLDYLYGVFRRAKVLPADLRSEVLTPVFTYCALTAQVDRSEPFYDDFYKFLMRRLKTSNFDSEFVVGLFNACEPADFPMFTSPLVRAVREFGFGDPEVRMCFDLVNAVVAVDGVAETLFAVPDPSQWKTYMSTDLKQALHSLANDSAFGVLLRLSVSAEKVADMLPSSVRGDISVTPAALKPTIKQNLIISESTDSMLFALVKRLVRKGPSVRGQLLLWYRHLLNANHHTTATAWSPDRTNEFHFLITALRVILSLAEPFVQLDDPNLQAQLAKINPNYFATNLSYDVSDQTKLLSEEDPPFNRQQKPENLNFVTECFFISVGLLHFAANATIESLNTRTGSLVRYSEAITAHQMQYYNRALAEIARAGPETVDPLNQSQIMKRMIERESIVRKANIASLSVRLESPELLTSLIRFCQFLFAFNVQSASNGTVTTAWAQPPPECFACLPEFFLEAPVQVMRYVMQTYTYMQDPSIGGRVELAVNAAVLFMSSPVLVKNPYLRSKFAEVLFMGSASVMQVNGVARPGPLSDMFVTSSTCKEHLLPALMAAFIDIEHTGRNSQFYEKFSIRNLIARVMEVMWKDPHYSKQLTKESEEKPEFFVKFVALLLNDSTYLLDEALTKLHKLHSLQSSDGTVTAANVANTSESGNPEGSGNSNNADSNANNDENGAEDEAPAETPEREVSKLRSQAKDLLGLSASCIDLLKAFTSSAPQIFATRELVDRFAVMLNYNLAALVGPRCRELRVYNPAEINFHPRELLKNVVQVYLFMRNEQKFPKAIAKDERSYSPELFRRAGGILKKNIISPVDLENFMRLAKNVLSAWEETRAEEEDFGDDVPDEYLDPLMFTIMEDPVTLPTSKVNIDLSTIKSHLLNDQTDPFNRVPLKIEDVIPNPELKQEIEQFRLQKKRAKNA